MFSQCLGWLPKSFVDDISLWKLCNPRLRGYVSGCLSVCMFVCLMYCVTPYDAHCVTPHLVFRPTGRFAPWLQTARGPGPPGRPTARKQSGSESGSEATCLQEKKWRTTNFGFWGTSKETKKLGKKPAETLFGPISRTGSACVAIDFFSINVSRSPGFFPASDFLRPDRKLAKKWKIFHLSKTTQKHILRV